MTTRERTSPQIQPYLDVLKTRLGSLSADERTELLIDLEDHLEEIIADDSHEPLSERIGSPDAYAAEFLASVGIGNGTASARSLTDTISDVTRRIAQRVESSRAADIWKEMEPAWWTVRGLAIGLLLTWNYLWPGNPNFPWILITGAGVLLPSFVWASMRLGHNRTRTNAWRWVSIGVTVLGIFAVFALSTQISARLDPYTYGSGQHSSSEYDFYPYGQLTDEDFQIMSTNGMGPEEYFDSGLFRSLRDGTYGPPVTFGPAPSGPPILITP